MGQSLVDEDNKPVWQWPYSAFGANKPTGILQATPNPRVAITNQPVLLKATAATELNLRFPGQYFDSETNLHYNYFRSYQPNQGRYTQGDPIGLDGGLNRFVYVDGDPVSYADPDGLQKRSGGGPLRPMYPPIGPAAVPSTHGHHSGPMFLGFPRNQELTPMARPLHEALHRDLNNFLRSQTNEFGQHMRPQPGNSGSIIRENFSRDRRLEAMREFYNRYGEHYPQAARDFFRQFPDQSFCGR